MPGVESVGGKRGVRGVLRTKIQARNFSWTGLQVSKLDPYSSRKSRYEIHEQKSKPTPELTRKACTRFMSKKS
jgi:hypothetical protein